MAGPFLRRSEFAAFRAALAKLSRLGNCGEVAPWIRNDTGADLERWSVLEVTGSIITAADDADQYEALVNLKGDLPSESDLLAVGVIPQAIDDGDSNRIILSGETYAKLIGPTGETMCGSRSGESTLTAGSGPITILFDPGPDDPQADPEGERIALVRLSGGEGRILRGGG